MDPQTEIYIEIQQGATWERVRSRIHNAPPECYLNMNLIRNLWNEKNGRAKVMVPVCGPGATVVDTANAPLSHKVVQELASAFVDQYKMETAPSGGLASIIADNYRAQETPSTPRRMAKPEVLGAPYYFGMRPVRWGCEYCGYEGYEADVASHIELSHPKPASTPRGKP